MILASFNDISWKRVGYFIVKTGIVQDMLEHRGIWFCNSVTSIEIKKYKKRAKNLFSSFFYFRLVKIWITTNYPEPETFYFFFSHWLLYGFDYGKFHIFLKIPCNNIPENHIKKLFKQTPLSACNNRFNSQCWKTVYQGSCLRTRLQGKGWYSKQHKPKQAKNAAEQASRKVRGKTCWT